MKKEKKNIKKDARFTFVVNNTTQLGFYTNKKDRFDKLANSYIV